MKTGVCSGTDVLSVLANGDGVSMDLSSLRRVATQTLEAGGIDDARRCVDWIIEDALGCSTAEIVANSQREVAPRDARRILKGVDRRLTGEPVQYIVGWTEFFGLRLEVSPAVLIPRPETEVLVEEVLSLQPASEARILDLGTGSGCIAIAVASRWPDAHVYGMDVSLAAVRVARSNAARLDLEVRFVLGDMTQRAWPEAIPDRFDIIVSNPPYIPAEEIGDLPRDVLAFEPSGALVSGPDALFFYRHLIDRAFERLGVGGVLVTETHSDHAGDVMDLYASAGLRDVQVRYDLAGLPRLVRATRP